MEVALFAAGGGPLRLLVAKDDVRHGAIVCDEALLGFRASNEGAGSGRRRMDTDAPEGTSTDEQIAREKCDQR